MTAWKELTDAELSVVKTRLEAGMQATVDSIVSGAKADQAGQLYGLRLSLLAQVEDELYAREKQ